jgi:uncharacterized protein (TIGR00369 family)
MIASRNRELLVRLFNERVPIAQTFGMRLSFSADEQPVVTLPYHPGLDHALGGVHGGVYATLLDSAAWFASAVSHVHRNWLTTSEMSIHFLRASARTELRALGRVLKPGKRQDIAEAKLYDGSGELVGHATATLVQLPGVSLEEVLGRLRSEPPGA